MGSRIVIASFGSFGDVYPYIGLALGLRDRGHHPVLAMPEYYREAVTREGLELHPVRPDVDPTDRALIRRIMDPRSGTELLIRDLIMGSLRESYADLDAATRGADLLVTHPITFAGPLIAQRDGLPWVSTTLAPISLFSAFDLPVFPPLRWTKRLERVPGLSAALVGLARRATGGWSEPVANLRHELGLPPGANPVFEGQHSPRLVLALFSRLLATPQPDWPANVVVTGGIPYNGPGGPSPLPPKLSEFLDSGPPPLVFTLGSSVVGAAGDFYEESAEAAGRLGARAVLLVGPHAANRPRRPLPPGVVVEEFAPHAALFPRSSAIVHQGGAGTLHQGLRSGRPTVVVPHAHDQPDNAHRVERLGVSRTIRPRRYRARRVARELATLLGEQSYAARAAEVATRVRAEDGVAAACGAIEALLRRPSG